MTKKFINDVEKHEILKQAAIYSYNVNKKQIPKGYKLVKESKPSNTGFYACALKKGNEIIIAFRGSNDKQDFMESDMQIFFKKMPAQRQEAHAFCREIIKENPNSEYYITGHSLGGALAQTEGALFHIPTATFNPVGVGSMLKKDSLKGYNDKIINYHTPGDFTSLWTWFDNIGTNYVVESYAPTINVFAHHSAEDMKPLQTAVPMTRHPHKSTQEYTEKVKNVVHSGISKVKSRLNNTFTKTMNNSQVEYLTSGNSCPGSYYVDGYTRADGTKVSGY